MAGVYVDNDISAYSGKPRPEYKRLAGGDGSRPNGEQTIRALGSGI